jgi:hypothetical protein
MQDVIVTKKNQLVQVYSRNGFLCRMSTCLGLFKREIGIKSNLPTILARQKLKESFKNDWLFDTDNTYVLFTKLIDISRSELIAKILVDIIDEDKQNDIGSIVFVTRTLVKRSSCFITQEEADEMQNLTETLLKDLF